MQRLEPDLNRKGSLPQKRGKERFCEVSLRDWIYAKYNKTWAQRLKHHPYYLIACTGSGTGLAAASGYSHVTGLSPLGNLAVVSMVLVQGHKSYSVRDLGAGVAPGSLGVRVWRWLRAAPRSSSTFTRVTQHPFGEGSCTTALCTASLFTILV